MLATERNTQLLLQSIVMIVVFIFGRPALKIRTNWNS